MLFNSSIFLVFFLAVVCLYWSLGKARWQNILLLAASLFFYGYGGPKFLSLIVICAMVGYLGGLALEKYDNKKVVLLTGVLIPCGILFVFKYFNFFVGTFTAAFSSLGILAPDDYFLNLALPIGISFYTFQTVAYLIDIYQGKTHAEKNPFDFILFVTFFPQLVAGPIERANDLIPQIKAERSLTYQDVKAGTLLIAQGFVKKLVVADSLAPVVNYLLEFDNLSAPLVLVAIFAFTFQIYGDFSGYTDIARGVARFFGFRLAVNFRTPYFSRDPSDFWRRWHITLSQWFRDYVYIGLGGNRSGVFATLRNLFLTMAICGLWHGASHNYILWGVYHGGILILHRLLTKNVLPASLGEKSWFTPIAVFSMFLVTMYGWLLFRVEELSKIFQYTNALFTDWTLTAHAVVLWAQTLPFVLIAVLIDVLERRKFDDSRDNSFLRYSYVPTVLAFLILIAVFMPEATGEFIYFKF